ncbi:MAG TPA: L-seryl-tRNA(Sec) selenium transferase [Acidobacteriota bacterium]|jgi:L-seryl-tRNA(Ser) seleniumtransferase
MDSLYRKIPSVDRVLQHDRLRLLLETHPRELVVHQVQRALSELRSQVQTDPDSTALEADIARLPETVDRLLRQSIQLPLRRVINATGVVIHTNLGRSPLDPEAIDYLREVSNGYCNIEYDLETGGRSHREIHIESVLEQITGHKVAAAVVNNNAAAVFLILETLASGGEVIVSRGELVEIGGSFRIPEILEKSGAKLREVGTTNKTRADDYARAISKNTRLILRVHPSNFHIVGFTERPALQELVELARRHELPLVEDLGSGLISDNPAFAETEPTVRSSLNAGVDLICFSGDKLLGATQAGVILGNPKWIKRIRSNPLMRALRLDKTGYAILVHSLYRYLTGEKERLPIHHFLTLAVSELKTRAEKLSKQVTAGRVELRDSFSLVGGGSAPDVKIDTIVLVFEPGERSAEAMHRFLRQQEPPIVARIEENRLIVDLRTVWPDDDTTIADAVNRFYRASDA